VVISRRSSIGESRIVIVSVIVSSSVSPPSLCVNLNKIFLLSSLRKDVTVPWMIIKISYSNLHITTVVTPKNSQ
jgi:hypothetical protein